MQEQIGKDIGVDMRKRKQFSHTDRQRINQEATKYRWTRNEIPIKIQLEITNIEKVVQYGTAIIALSTSQQTVLTAYAKALEEKHNADEYKHIFKLSIIGANAITQPRKEIKLPLHFRIVASNNVLPTDIITEDKMERIKRYSQQKNLGYQAAAIAMQQEMLNTTASNQMDFQGEGENFNAFREADAVADVEDSQLIFKRARMPSRCYHIIHELNTKIYKAHPHH
ncbi:MAG: hypothetical protein EZS28_037972 [Streblomastix strix]|uniref:Uncharacterized protein n=1 Tax=Streblomastix strix TaxID=222440 RepID=A0A5J4U9C6_9EUKA|nr:MAG: hypothetical protein EZS28_037972 [Streblomastix strix]